MISNTINGIEHPVFDKKIEGKKEDFHFDQIFRKTEERNNIPGIG